jgi:hypothetical protein
MSPADPEETMPLPSYFAEQQWSAGHRPAPRTLGLEDMPTLQGDASSVHQLVGVARIHLESIWRAVERLSNDARETEKGPELRALEQLVRGHRSLLAAIEPASDWIASNLDFCLWQLPEADCRTVVP